ncbi:hypothetical protein BD560DRAFT_383466 [Blakeslea trispora]|nr:hypothetical protein BD560DRAFT_383466 [Blakeslea trispora]
MRNHLFPILLLIFFLLSVYGIYENSSDETTKTVCTTVYSTTPTLHLTAIQQPLPSHLDNSHLEASLASDQQALKRMVMILSLVGGLGVIAIVTTIVLLSRMRKRTKRHALIDDRDENSTFMSLEDRSISPESSAPPLINEATEDPDYSCYDTIQPTLFTHIPSPSAPTAKELAIVDDDSNSIQGLSSTDPTCVQCSPRMIASQLPPPPAYTPSAPPHDTLPVIMAMQTIPPSLGS